jgi:Tol biopolymer transport system component/DNA-binding winged helix-turn-helix (wHTH) protein
VLLFLLRNPGKLVTKDEIFAAVWNDSFVSDNSLTKSVATLRRLLGDDAREPRYIVTVQTVGYRFLCEVAATEESTGVPAPPSILQTSDDPAITATADVQVRRGSRRLPVLIAIACLLLVLAGAVLAVHVGGHSSKSAGHAGRMRMTPILSVPGKMSDPAFSPNSEEIAFVWDGENPVRGDVYVHLIGGGKPLRLTHSESGFTCCASWSPDGHQLAFGRCDDSGGAVFVVPALGGAERKVTSVACIYGNAGWPIWTTDGKSMVIADQCSPKGSIGIVRFSLATGERQCLSQPEPGDRGDRSLAVSPDGRTLAFIRMHSRTVNEICTVPVEGGSTRLITSDGGSFWGLMWSSDGKRIVFRSPRQGINRNWSVSRDGGPVTAESIYPEIGSQSHDGARLVYVESPGNLPTETLRVTLARPGGRVLATQTLFDSASTSSAPQLSPDGREVAFESDLAHDAGWTMEIWKSRSDGSDALQLTSYHGHAGTPRWSPDGKSIAFDYRPGLRSHIYVMDSEGRNPHPVTFGPFEQQVPSWSHDGKSIYYTSSNTGNWQVWQCELASGKERQITQQGGYAAFESYDGKTVYYSKYQGGGIWTVPTAGGPEGQITTALHHGYWGYFAVTDSGIYFLDADTKPAPTILFYDFHSRHTAPVLTLKENPIPWFAGLAASRDGLTLFFVQYKLTSSITMAENFQ